MGEKTDMNKKSFPHGIHPDEAKELTAGKKIKRFPFPPYLVMLLSQHAGKPAKPVVRQGQEVRRGQLIAEADGFVSAPIHSPASGTIKSISKALDSNGRLVPAIIVEPYAASGQSLGAAAPRALEDFTPQEIVEGIRSMGMVGLGGAAFPTHVKFSLPPGKHVDTLIVNGCECEPYLTADHQVMLEQPDLVVLGARLALKALGAERGIVGIESNKLDAVEVMRKAFAPHPEFSVQVCETKYPQGAEKMLTKALLGREIPSGGLPADAGVMCSNITTLAEIGALLPYGRGLIERVISITGEGVKRPGNYLVAIGTPLEFILEHVGLVSDAFAVIFGGPMMGKAVSFLETPITKGVSGILVLTAAELGEHARRTKVFPCIRCGECLRACPMMLNPSQLGRLARKDRFDVMADKYHLYDCFECGCCTYTCPANIPLVQYIRMAKQILRERRVS